MPAGLPAGLLSGLLSGLLAGWGCSTIARPAQFPASEPASDARQASREALADWLPAGFPPPPVPADNPVTPEKIELGRRLFYDARLSGTGRTSCATCHQPELGFTDGRARAVGGLGDSHRRSTMSLANVAYNASYTWADPTIRSLEEQMLRPMFQDDPVELGLTGRVPEILERLAADPELRAAFTRAFPDERRAVTLSQVIRAIASYERTLLSGDSPYDRLVYWGEEALSPGARRGMELFFSERLACGECHAGFNLSGTVRAEGATAEPLAFHNTGLYDEDGAGGYPATDRGLEEVSGRPEDSGRFRAPTLRNIALTAPYMHDGSIATLAEVVTHYAAGGRARAGAAADPERPTSRSPLVKGFEISAEETADLLAFLESLTDERFLERHRPPR